MNGIEIVAAVLAALFAGASLLIGLMWSKERVRAEGLSAELRAAEAGLARLEERARGHDETSSHVQAAFKAMSAEAVAHASQALLKQAEEAFASRDRLVQERLFNQLRPVAETLTKFEAQVAALEARRAEDQGGLKEQIAQLMTASAATQEEARKLSQALRRGAGVQGRWGEQTLRNVLETAGLAARFDFEEQFSVDTDEGRRRPDVKVRLPGGGVFVIDAKCSLTAFLEAQEAADEAGREAAMARHAVSVRTHMAGLAGKAYWDQFQREGSPDFVAMFVPGDGFLAAALDRAPELMTEAMDRRVLIVTPTTLFALCKAVAYGWRVEGQAENAAAVAQLGKELYKRLSVMGGHVSGVGKALEQAVGKYNQFIGSLESQVLTQAKRFEELEVEHVGAEIPDLPRVETAVRPVTKLTLLPVEGEGGADATYKALAPAPALTPAGGETTSHAS